MLYEVRRSIMAVNTDVVYVEASSEDEAWEKAEQTLDDNPVPLLSGSNATLDSEITSVGLASPEDQALHLLGRLSNVEGEE